MKGTLIMNPRAGSRDPEKLEELERATSDAGLDTVRLGPDDEPGSIARDCVARGARQVVVAGGDGTIHHVIQGLVESDAVIGVVPFGTFNHLAFDLGIPEDWQEALDVALTGSARRIDVGRVNDRWFVNNLMLGVYPEIVEHRERARGKMGKWRAYAHASRFAFRTFPHASLVIETPHHLETVRTHLFAVAVNPYDLSRMGILAPKTALDLGRLSVYWLPFMNRFRFARAIARYLSGRLDSVEGFRHISTTRMRVDSPHHELKVVVDGELFRMRSPLQISIVPSSLHVRVPEGRGERSGDRAVPGRETPA